ncbi:hypothetical protein, partial [Pseudomonas viridiflava]|uniref:hypothetical protein n=1 Tax=Pseudomonas viridiflava TaxID=33069 RepID=UPI001981D570
PAERDFVGDAPVYLAQRCLAAKTGPWEAPLRLRQSAVAQQTSWSGLVREKVITSDKYSSAEIQY